MSFTCPVCGMTSHHPADERFGYCLRCHDFTGSAEKVGCPACAPIPAGAELGPGCEQCEGEGWVWQVPDWEWGCEECDFATSDQSEALAHCDEAKHSLAMRPVRSREA